MATTEAELGNLLHLSAVSGNGHLWHTIRYESGNWSPFIDVEGEAGDIGFVVMTDLQSMGGPVHLCAINGAGDMFHTYRRPDGTWLPFEDVKAKAGDVGPFDGLGICATGGFRDGQLHIFGVTTHSNKIYHAILKADGATWVNFIDVEGATQAGEIGQVYQVTCTGDVYPAAYDLHLCASTLDGNLWHTIRGGDGRWMRFESVKVRGAGDPGKFIDITCEMVGRDLHLFGVTEGGRLWHTVRNPGTGVFSPFKEVIVAGGSGYVYWVGIGGSNSLLQLAAITSNPQLWHSLRDPLTGTFGPFGDVEIQAGDLGNPLTVSVHGLNVLS